MLKSLFRKLLIIALELLLISGALWFVAERRGIRTPAAMIAAIQQAASQTAQNMGSVQAGSQEKVFPVLDNPIKRTYNWQYKGMNYSLSETLYQSSYDFYNSEPKTFSYTGSLPADWEDEYYAMFLKGNATDHTIAQLASDLQALGQKHNLTSDQLVDMTMAFVQSIPYDDSRAKEILSQTGNVQMQYPYETLYRQLGVCSDKSLLATSILRQMGYGAALFAYEQDNHMAIGVQCPKDSSTYGSGYCYGETTAVGNKIGIIPSFDVSTNKTVSVGELSAFDASQTQQSNLQQLGQVTIFQQTTGKEYDGVAQTQEDMTEIDSLKKNIDTTLPELQAMKKNIDDEQNNLQNMRNELDTYKNSQNIEKYNAEVGNYNDYLKNYQKDVKSYNSSVTLYNQSIARYNVLIKQ